jgi:hypothetical protein
MKLDLRAYPRPAHDTGIGVHWCAGASYADPKVLRTFWIPELQEMGVTWVKLCYHQHVHPLIEEFLAAGIMPVVRLPDPAPPSTTLSPAQLSEVESLVQLGARYFEVIARAVNQNLNLQRFSRESPLTQATRDFAADLEAILALGGLPSIPAFTPGDEEEWVRRLLELGSEDLLAAPLWQAVRNFGGNRPLNYPHDPGNRDGSPITREYYQALQQEQWGNDSWQGWDLESINRLRRDATLGVDAALRLLPADTLCWLDYERIDAQNQALLGRSLPLLSISGGWVVGGNDDPRYPVVTPQLHMAHTLEACRTMMGTSRRYPPAPDYYFCTAFWLLANELLESDQPVHEWDAWYSQVWPHRMLPVVPALKFELKRARLTSRVAAAGGRQPPAAVAAEIDFAAEQRRTASSVVEGQVRGGAHAVVHLVRSDGLLLRTVARADGSYRFVDLAGGRYTVWAEDPPGSRRERIDLDGRSRVEAPLTVDGWGYEVRPVTEATGVALRCRVEGSAAVAEVGTLAVRVRRTDDIGGQSGRVVSMARRADGASSADVAPLASGEYRVDVLGLITAGGDPHPLSAVVEVNGPTQLTFLYSRPFERGYLRFSQIFGRVADGVGRQLLLTDSHGQSWNAEVDEDEQFSFESLLPGVYSLAVAGYEHMAARNRLALDGKNQVECNFSLHSLSSPEEAQAAERGGVRVHVPDLVGEAFTLIDMDGGHETQRVSADGIVRFQRVKSGTYTLGGSGYWQPGLEVLRGRHLVVELPPLAPIWDWEVIYHPTLTQKGMVRVQVSGRQGVTVRLEGEHGMRQETETGAASDFFFAHFGPLGPGEYTVMPEGLDAQADFELPADNAATIIFRRGGAFGGHLRVFYE